MFLRNSVGYLECVGSATYEASALVEVLDKQKHFIEVYPVKTSPISRL
jgi:hypothetical protein